MKINLLNRIIVEIDVYPYPKIVDGFPPVESKAAKKVMNYAWKRESGRLGISKIALIKYAREWSWSNGHNAKLMESKEFVETMQHMYPEYRTERMYRQ